MNDDRQLDLFYNTTHLSSDELLRRRLNAAGQCGKIYRFFRDNPAGYFTPFEVRQYICMMDTPITSIRRALNTLTASGHLVKTDVMKEGDYGMTNHYMEARKRKPWTPAEITVLEMLYADHTSIEIADALGRTLSSIYGMAKTMNLNKSEAFLRSSQSGRIKNPNKETWFPKGHVPYNKGKKMAEYCSPETIKKISETYFKKGHLPVNTKHDGAIVIRRDSRNRAYKWIRTTRGVWIPLHVHNWILTYGPVPDGYIVVFKSRDNMNCDISNLEIITREENMRRNTWYRYPNELRQAMRKLKQLKRQINEKQDTGPKRPSLRDNRVA